VKLNHAGLIRILFKDFPNTAIGVFFLPRRFKEIDSILFLRVTARMANNSLKAVGDGTMWFFLPCLDSPGPGSDENQCWSAYHNHEIKERTKVLKNLSL